MGKPILKRKGETLSIWMLDWRARVRIKSWSKAAIALGVTRKTLWKWRQIKDATKLPFRARLLCLGVEAQAIQYRAVRATTVEDRLAEIQRVLTLGGLPDKTEAQQLDRLEDSLAAIRPRKVCANVP